VHILNRVYESNQSLSTIDWQEYSNGEIISTMHCMNNTEVFTMKRQWKPLL